MGAGWKGGAAVIKRDPRSIGEMATLLRTRAITMGDSAVICAYI